MTKYELIIFDWDGTLVDSFNTIITSVKKAASLCCLPLPDDQHIRDIIGLSFKDAWPRLFPGTDFNYHEGFLQQYSQQFAQIQHQSKLFPPTKQLLQDLTQKGYLLAIATGKGRQGLDRDLAHHHLTDYFVTTRTVSESFSKPNPQMVYDILDYTGIENHQALIVGDSIYDMQMAYNANVNAVHVNTVSLHQNQEIQNIITHQIHCISQLGTILSQPF